MNASLDHMLGYEGGVMVGHRLDELLGSRTAEFLAEEIEYKDDGADLGEVLARQRDIRLRDAQGKELVVACTTSRMMAEGVNARFQLVIPNEQEKLANQKIRDFIALNLAGLQQLDASTGLPNRETAVHFLPLLKNYLAESNIDVSFAVLRLDRYAKSVARYGAENCPVLLQHVAKCCTNSFRREDIVFALSDHTLGLLLFDIRRESARLVLNRLRGNIRSHSITFGGKQGFSSTVSLAFDMMEADGESDILTRCESAVLEYDADERNGLIELGN